MDNIIIETIDTEVTDNGNIDVSGNNNIEIVISEPDYSVTVNKKEYVITGDELYIPKTYEESPQWLRDLIDTITDTSLNQKINELNNLTTTLNQLIIELDVAKNTYTNSIISSADIDERINTRIETLNSSLSDSDATIVDLIATKATPTQASSIATDVLNASINGTTNGTIGALVGSVQTAVANLDTALSNSIDVVHAEMIGENEITAEAIGSLQAYVGVDSAGASSGTGLSAYLEGSDGIVGSATSNVANLVYTDGGTSKSKFEYNSSLSVAGQTYQSGFGLVTSTSNINGKPSSGSEFWINASKFKFTNPNNTGAKAPFTIDATGTIPDITFNGKVAFTNVTGYTPPDVSGSINTNNDTFSQKLGYANYAAMVTAAASDKTIVTGGFLRTSLIDANSITASQINADSALISKLNVTGGIIANNIVVPGVNGGNNLFSASGSEVVISNLKVLGTVSLPGISKGGSFAVPTLGVGSTYSVTVNKPYACNNWSVTAIVSLTNITGYGETTNFGCRLYVGGSQVSIAQGVSNWAINVSTTGTRGSLPSSSIDISINTSGFGDAAGSFYGSISYIAIVEN